MKLLCVSDLHQYKPVLAPSDLLVIAGDITDKGTRAQAFEMLDYLASMRRDIVLVPGNHDKVFQSEPEIMAQACSDRGIRLLVESGCEINGIKFWGSPYTPRFGGWAFMYDWQQARGIWSKIPNGTDVLITHGPPQQILDLTENGDHCGSLALLEQIFDYMHPLPQLHVFGHIHEGYGTVEINGTRFVNASYCNAAYEPVNEPQEVEV